MFNSISQDSKGKLNVAKLLNGRQRIQERQKKSFQVPVCLGYNVEFRLFW